MRTPAWQKTDRSQRGLVTAVFAWIVGFVLGYVVKLLEAL